MESEQMKTRRGRKVIDGEKKGMLSTVDVTQCASNKLSFWMWNLTGNSLRGLSLGRIEKGRGVGCQSKLPLPHSVQGQPWGHALICSWHATSCNTLLLRNLASGIDLSLLRSCRGTERLTVALLEGPSWPRWFLWWRSEDLSLMATIVFILNSCKMVFLLVSRSLLCAMVISVH